MSRNHADDVALQDLLNKYLIPWPRCGADVGKGWFVILDELFRDLIALGWDRKCDQIKEKFGYLNVYVPAEESSAIHDRVILAQKLSMVTCEFCGKPGKAQSGGWVKTLCDQCDRDRGR